jgi:hypothetical protein
MVMVVIAYVIRFFWVLGHPLADKAEVWGQFGDYLGGSLNPILSFITILLLIKSMNLQKQENLDLREEVEENRRTEKLRSFGVLFFNMIASQKALLDSFTTDINAGAKGIKPGASSIICIENEVERLRDHGASDAEIAGFLEATDSEDKIYGVLRAFYVTVKIVTEKLSDENGFSSEDRREHLLTLIHFTDFAQMRLVILTIQFMNYPSGEYLRNNVDFNVVLDDVGLHLDPYQIQP